MQRQAKSGGTPRERPIARGVWGPWTPCLLALALCLTALGDAGDEPPSADFSPRTHYQAVLAVARQRRVEPTNAVTAAWEFARACFDLAEHPADSGERQRLGNEGAQACREALALDPDSGPAQYYLALNLGQVAQTKLIGALRLVRQMETALLAAIRLDPRLDFAGPDRSLGILYRDAPGWPTSIGSRAKSAEHLERAVALDPTYPGNRLALAESRLAWGEPDAARPHLAALVRDWATNRVRLAGPDWHTSWVEWRERRTRLERALAR